MLLKLLLICIFIYILYKLFSKLYCKKTNLFISNSLYVKKSNLNIGYGVFTTSFIPKNTIIERSYGLILKPIDRKGIISNYDFYINKNTTFLGLGYSSIYNHSDNPNLEYDIDLKKQIITLKTTKNIYPNQELFLSYCDDDEWFTSRDITRV